MGSASRLARVALVVGAALAAFEAATYVRDAHHGLVSQLEAAELAKDAALETLPQRAMQKRPGAPAALAQPQTAEEEKQKEAPVVTADTASAEEPEENSKEELEKKPLKKISAEVDGYSDSDTRSDPSQEPCPEKCGHCKGGDTDDGRGKDLLPRVGHPGAWCTAHCSFHNYCGDGEDYAGEDSVNCNGCREGANTVVDSTDTRTVAQPAPTSSDAQGGGEPVQHIEEALDAAATGDGYVWADAPAPQPPPQTSRDRPRPQRAAVDQHGIPAQIRIPDEERTDIKTPPDSGSVLVVEQHLGEWSGSADHRITSFGFLGRPFEGDDLHQSLLRIQLLTTRQLEACGTPYTVWMGTMLGAYRHHGMVPWDSDVDLLIEYRSLEPLLTCLDGVKPEQNGGLRWIVRWPNSQKLGMNDVLPLKVVDPANGYYADIFVTFCDEAGTCSYNEFCPDGMREGHGACLKKQVKHYKASDLWPPRTCLFEGRKMQCAPGIEAILMLTYVDDGKGWRSKDGLGVPDKYTASVTGELFTEPEWA